MLDHELIAHWLNSYTAALLFLITCWIVVSLLQSQKPSNPCPVPGLPLLGNSLQIGKLGATFVGQCKAKYGDAFTYNLVGQKMTFISSPSLLSYFFTAPADALSFAPAVQQFTERVFGLPQHHLLGKHHLLLSTLRHQLVPSALDAHAAKVLDLLHLHMQELLPVSSNNNTSIKVELYTVIKELLFTVGVSCLFGPTFIKRHGVSKLQSDFTMLDDCFEMAASPVPHLFQPSFRRARHSLLNMLQESYKKGDFNDTIVDALIKGCGIPSESIPNMLLAVLWASQANTAPTAFWAIAFLLLPQHKHIRMELQDTIQNLKTPTDLIAMCRDRSSLVTRCVLEGLRLRSPCIDVRIAASDLNLHDNGKELHIRKGTVVAICPYETHIDSRIYTGSDTYEFNPNRTAFMMMDGKTTSKSHKGSNGMHSAAVGVGGLAGVAFGGGQYRCPGRSFAELELSLVVALFMSRCDVELSLDTGMEKKSATIYPGDREGMLPDPDMSKLVGVRVPVGPCWVNVKRRDN